jgi:prolipoprotein diacylglyceryltransferase
MDCLLDSSITCYNYLRREGITLFDLIMAFSSLIATFTIYVLIWSYPDLDKTAKSGFYFAIILCGIGAMSNVMMVIRDIVQGTIEQRPLSMDYFVEMSFLSVLLIIIDIGMIIKKRRASKQLR